LGQELHQYRFQFIPDGYRLADKSWRAEMRRREFIAGLGAAAWPLAARAQQPAVARIGLLQITTPEGDAELLSAVRAGLAEMGFVEGKNLVIEYRWANNHPERLPALADDLVRHRVAVIIALGGTATAKGPFSTDDQSTTPDQ
jgi:putative tryptophan/tyrosine transport system substrate-binding protein